MGYEKLEEDINRLLSQHMDVTLRELAQLFQEFADRFTEEADQKEEDGDGEN
jgi:hypothetical protein